MVPLGGRDSGARRSATAWPTWHCQIWHCIGVRHQGRSIAHPCKRFQLERIAKTGKQSTAWRRSTAGDQQAARERHVSRGPALQLEHRTRRIRRPGPIPDRVSSPSEATECEVARLFLRCTNDASREEEKPLLGHVPRRVQVRRNQCAERHNPRDGRLGDADGDGPLDVVRRGRRPYHRGPVERVRVVPAAPGIDHSVLVLDGKVPREYADASVSG